MASFIEEMKQLWFLDFVVSPKNENIIYFSSGWFNGLIEANVETGNTRVRSTFDGERNLVGGLHKDAVCVRDKIYFAPRNTNYLNIYDINTNEMKAIRLPKNDLYWQERNAKFIKIILHGNCIDLIPCNYNQILRFDIDKEEFVIFRDWFGGFQQHYNYKEVAIKYVGMFSNCIVCDDGYLLHVTGTKEFMYFNSKTGEYSFINGPEKKIVSVQKSIDHSHMICEDGSCWCFDDRSKGFLFKYFLDIDSTSILYEFERVHDVFYIPSKIANEIVIYDANSGKKITMEFKTEGKKHINSIGYKWNIEIVWIKRIGDELWLLNTYNEIIIFDMSSETYSIKHLGLNDVQLEMDVLMNKDYYCEKYTYFPYNSSNLDIFMPLIKELGINNTGNIGIECGEKIYETVK